MVKKDYYGAVSLYDPEGLLVVIDPITKVHKKYNEEGLEVRRDSQGNVVLYDKRNHIVKELGDTY